MLLLFIYLIVEATGNRDVGFSSGAHDIKLLLLRFAEEKTFHEDTGGGGPESNMHLVPYLFHTALYVLNTTRAALKESNAVDKFLLSTPSSQWKDDAYALGKPIWNAGMIERRTTAVVDNSNYITNAAFGADLFVPVNGYQKTMRSVKYSVLCILLTFSAFFLIETTNKRSVHPFQYGLIGLALVLFYILLLSFSEYIGFTASYIIASIATIGLIAWFAKSILFSGRLSGILSLVLVLMYSYVFTILQLQDYSLLFGSIGLFITLAIIMYFSRKIQW